MGRPIRVVRSGTGSSIGYDACRIPMPGTFEPWPTRRLWLHTAPWPATSCLWGHQPTFPAPGQGLERPGGAQESAVMAMRGRRHSTVPSACAPSATEPNQAVGIWVTAAMLVVEEVG